MCCRVCLSTVNVYNRLFKGNSRDARNYWIQPMKEPVTLDIDALEPLMTDDFALGVATAAYQIEGAAGIDGRTDSVWDSFCRQPGKIADKSSGDVACDHYSRWKEDVALLVELDVDVYRFSISWSRIFPDSSGVINEKGMAFYKDLAEELRRFGIRPMVTLHHWDLPQYLQDKGGWQNRMTAYHFSDFAKAVADGLGASVDFYATLNEPWCIAHLGHRSGMHAPGLRDEAAATAATHHLLLAHGLAMQELREHAPRAELGIVLNGGPSFPVSKSQDDIEAAKLFESQQIHRFAGPIFAGEYPEEFAPEVAEYVQSGDMRTISQACDYLGWNYYSRNNVQQGPDGNPEVLPGNDYPTTDMGWEIYPDGLRQVCSLLQNCYELPPLYITENGAAIQDELIGSTVQDTDRIHYVHRHLQVVADMIRAGADIRGYVCWTLLDNFEWAEGYSKRFGLVHVDFATQKRTMKDSFKWFAELTASKKGQAKGRNEKRANVAR